MSHVVILEYDVQDENVKLFYGKAGVNEFYPGCVHHHYTETFYYAVSLGFIWCFVGLLGSCTLQVSCGYLEAFVLCRYGMK